MANKAGDSKLVKFTAFFYTRWRMTLTLWVLLLAIGAFTYTSVIKREGFPPIQFPLSFVSGAYIGEGKDAVDSDILVPLSAALVEQDAVTDVNTSANDGFFTAAVSFNDSVTSITGTELVQRVIEDTSELPQNAIISAVAIDPGSFLFEFDLVAQVYSTQGADPATLDRAAQYVAEQLKELEIVNDAQAKTNISQNERDPTISVQSSFSRVGLSSADDDSVNFYGASTIGVQQSADSDAIELSEAVDAKLASLDLSQFGDGLETVISADFATDIISQIDFLESNMATGLLAVAFLSFLLITWRASLITGLFMISVMVATILTLYVIGFTLNVITLFALILSLGLFVDDATIVVEAIDVNSRNKKLKALEVVKQAVSKVGMASLAGTLTTVLVFAILATPTGILGEFIRLIPITVIIALILSFILSLTLIPFLAKFLILRDRKISWITKVNPILKLEDAMGRGMQKVVLSIRTTKGKMIAAASVLFSIVAIFSGMYIFAIKVDQNTFPPAKDTDQLGVQIQFISSSSVEEASEVALRIDKIVSDTIGDQVLFAYYGGELLADSQQATIMLDLVPFTDRDVKSPELAEMLNNAFGDQFDSVAKLNVGSVDNGPPTTQFPFGIRVYSDDESVLQKATADIANTFVGTELENFNGEKIAVIDSQIDGLSQSILRDNGRRYAITKLSYASTNPTIVALLTEQEFKDTYGGGELSALSITFDDIEYDAGQEGDFQDSFNTLILAIPIAMFLMYLLLAVQFKSFFQPFLILLAIPFTIFGVGFGLFITDNAASFFSLVGFIGLIGIAVNNTIMLTDYANQERRNGAGAVDAIATAARKRLRPLITTTFTTVVALLPLALSDPFWEALAYTIIFGLVSSTILVILSFPYYYLAAEWLRMRTSKISRRVRKVRKAVPKR
jgi:multidrug efflux pump subunit AcrB